MLKKNEAVHNKARSDKNVEHYKSALKFPQCFAGVPSVIRFWRKPVNRWTYEPIKKVVWRFAKDDWQYPENNHFNDWDHKKERKQAEIMEAFREAEAYFNFYNAQKAN